MDTERYLEVQEKYAKIRETWTDAVGPGWHGLLDTLFSTMEQMEFRWGCSFWIQQIKEKFGTLRFYYSSEARKGAEWALAMLRAMAHEAEALSGGICEECGQPGQARSGGWIKTLCDQCNQPMEKS